MMMSSQGTQFPFATITQGKNTKVIIDRPLNQPTVDSRNKSNRIKIKLSTQKMKLIEQERELSKERVHKGQLSNGQRFSNLN